jgi:hypothetical protein
MGEAGLGLLLYALGADDMFKFRTAFSSFAEVGVTGDEGVFAVGDEPPS